MYLEEVEQPVEMITQVNKQLLMWLKRLWDLKKKKKITCTSKDSYRSSFFIACAENVIRYSIPSFITLHHSGAVNRVTRIAPGPHTPRISTHG